MVAPKPENELPEIPLDDLLEERPPAQDSASDGLEIDIDADPLAGPATEPAQPEPQARAPLDVGVNVDLDITSGPAFEPPPPAPQPESEIAIDDLVAAPAPAPAPVPPKQPSAPAATRPIVNTAPRPPTTITSALDIDALLSDLELPKSTPRLSDDTAPVIPATEPAVANEVHHPDADAIGTAAAAPPETPPADTELTIDVSAPDNLSDEPEPDAPLTTGVPPSNDVLAANLTAAPPLPLLENEPPPRPAISPSDLPSTEEAIETLKKLAGPGFDPEGTRIALISALAGEPYDLKSLPEPRVMLLGMARVMIASGVNRDDLVDAIMAALDD